LEPLAEITLSQQLSAIACSDGVLYGLVAESPGEITVIDPDGTLEQACMIESTDSRTISDFCKVSDGWLLRLNDTSLILVDNQGNEVTTLQTATASISAAQEHAVALEYSFSEGQYTLYTVTAAGFELGQPIELPEADEGYKATWSEDGILLYGNSTVFQCEDSVALPLCSYSALGNTILVLPSGEGLLVVTDQGLFQFQSPDAATNSEAETETQETATLTLATALSGYCQDGYIKQAVSAFNAAHADVTIVIKDYLQGNNSYTEAMTALNLDIAAGDGPDLIDTAAFPADVYRKNGTLISLGDRVQTLNLEEYHPNLVAALTLVDDVYSVMAAYQIQCVAIDNTYLASAEDGWDLAEFSALVESLPEDWSMFYNDPEIFLSEWCDSCITDYIQGSTCSFDSDSFLRLLEAAGNLSRGEGDYSAAWIESIQHVDGFRQSQMTKAETLSATNMATYIGMPSDLSSGVAFEQTISMGISAQSAYSDLCWEFIEYLLSEDFQASIVGAMLPVRTDVLYEEINREMSVADSPLSQTQADSLTAIIDKADHLYGAYSEVKSIVMEEAEAYFSGDKTAAETSGIIQNRVSIYLAEQS
jgi:ABC-type glycerol-3-phosphate transport system substrate-binding protein